MATLFVGFVKVSRNGAKEKQGRCPPKSPMDADGEFDAILPLHYKPVTSCCSDKKSETGGSRGRRGEIWQLSADVGSWTQMGKVLVALHLRKSATSADNKCTTDGTDHTDVEFGPGPDP